MVASALVGLLLSSVTSRISTKISLRVNNDIQAEVFDRLDVYKRQAFEPAGLQIPQEQK